MKLYIKSRFLGDVVFCIISYSKDDVNSIKRYTNLQKFASFWRVYFPPVFVGVIKKSLSAHFEIKPPKRGFFEKGHFFLE